MALRDRSFTELIHRLAEERYHGNYHAMAKALKFTTSVVYAWKDGVIKSPSMPMIERLGAHFGIDPMDIYRVVRRSRMLLLAVMLGALASAAAPATLGAATPPGVYEDYVIIFGLWVVVAHYLWRRVSDPPRGTTGR